MKIFNHGQDRSVAGFPSFDPALSLKLDGLIIEIERAPSRPRRIFLRMQKRWVERRVPSFTRSIVPIALREDRAL